MRHLRTVVTWEAFLPVCAVVGLLLATGVWFGISYAGDQRDQHDRDAAIDNRQDLAEAQLGATIRELRALDIRTEVLRDLTPGQARQLRRFLVRTMAERGQRTEAPRGRAPLPRLVAPGPRHHRAPGATQPAPTPPGGPSPGGPGAPTIPPATPRPGQPLIHIDPDGPGPIPTIDVPQPRLPSVPPAP